MSVLIENIHRTLNALSLEWDWELSYAPKPGQQRIKFTATNRLHPGQKKVLVLTEELVKQIPHIKLASNILQILPTLPESPTGEPPASPRESAQPMKRVEANLTAPERYAQLQHIYQGTLQSVRATRGPATASPAFRRRPDWPEAIGKGLHRVLQQLSRNPITR